MITNNGQKLLSVSIDPVPDKELVSYIREIADIKADYLHCDVMDGIFVEQATYDENYIRALNRLTTMPLDVHLMTINPFDTYKEYIAAGANILTVHCEAFDSRRQLIKVLKNIRKKNVICGVAISPTTEINEVMDFLAYADIVLVMSVEPGLSGQQFNEETYLKVALLDKMRKQFNFNFFMSVDGGITPEIAFKLKSLGADMIVSGSYIFNSKNRRIDARLFKQKEPLKIGKEKVMSQTHAKKK